ncbi:MAG: hypothetical protein RL553_1747 [Planctomycetota bacterium]|jgi:hypothetical protein
MGKVTFFIKMIIYEAQSSTTPFSRTDPKDPHDEHYKRGLLLIDPHVNFYACCIKADV